MCCSAPKWKEEIKSNKVTDHKFDFVDLEEFKYTSFSGKITGKVNYSFFFLVILKSVLIYIADIWTAGLLLIFDRWGSAIQPKIPFYVSKWIYIGCIFASFLLLAWDIRKAKKIYDSRDISYAFTNMIAYRAYTLKSYAHFCFFSKINNSRKWVDKIAFFVFFAFKGWKRLVFAEAPRQAINAITLYYLIQLNKKKQYLDINSYGDSVHRLAMATMAFSLFLFIFSFIKIVAAVILYIPLLCHIRGNLKEYCCFKIDKRIGELLVAQTKRRIESAKKQQQSGAEVETKGDFGHIGKKKDGEARPFNQPTLPTVNYDYDYDYDYLGDTLPPYGLSRTGTPVPQRVGTPNLTVPSRTGTINYGPPLTVPSRSGTINYGTPLTVPSRTGTINYGTPLTVPSRTGTINLGPPSVGTPTPDYGPPRSRTPEPGPPRVGTPDHGPPRSRTPEPGPPRVGTPDYGPPRSRTPELGPPRVGTPDYGPPRVGTPDYGPPRIGNSDYGPPRVGTPNYGPPRNGTLGHGPPRFGTPGYGPPRVGTPGYGPPRVGTPGYGPPRVGTPGYGPPRVGTPGYGPPRIGTPLSRTGTPVNYRGHNTGQHSNNSSNSSELSGYSNNTTTAYPLGSGHQYQNRSQYSALTRTGTSSSPKTSFESLVSAKQNQLSVQPESLDKNPHNSSDYQGSQLTLENSHIITSQSSELSSISSSISGHNNSQ